MATSIKPYDMQVGAMRTLASIMALTGTHKKVNDLRRAGRIVCRIEDILDADEYQAPTLANSQQLTDAEAKALKDWQAMPLALDLSERERELCRSTFKDVCEKGSLNANRQVLALLYML